MRSWRDTRDALLALAALAFFIWLATLVDRYLGNPDRIVAGGQHVRVIDGDSLHIGDSEIRLYGIDAPEYRQSCTSENGEAWPCGREARAALERLANEPGLHCEALESDRYRRTVARCGSDDHADIGAVLVREGWAVSLSPGNVPVYPFAEAVARANDRGIWRGDFVRPAEWREAQRD